MRCLGPRHRGGRPDFPSGRPRLSTSALGSCAALLVLVLAGCQDAPGSADAPPDPEPKPVYVELFEVQPVPVRDVIALTGQLDAENVGTIKSELSGVIEEILFEEGQRVSRGDLLFRLRDREQRARLMEARAEQRLARDVFDRTQRLSDEAVSSVAREIEVAAELDKAKARTELALVELERTEVRAPFDGVLGVRLVAVGDRVENEEPLVEIYAIDRLQAIFTVQEQGVPLAQVGLPVQVRVAAYGSEQFPGRVFFVAPALDAASRRLIMKAWIDNSDGRLKPGMFVNVDVEVARKEAALMVPESAVVYDRNGIFVWRDRPEGGAQKVPVELGLRQEGRVEVLEGLAPGDVVVATGINKVRAGSRLADPRRAPDEPIHAQDQAARAEGGAS